MAIGAIGFNPFDYNPQQLQKIGAIGTKGGEGVGGAQKHQPQFAPQGAQGLDADMLATKAANFQNGLGGTNNPDNHKLFLVG